MPRGADGHYRAMPITSTAATSHRLAARLARDLEGEVLFDRFSRGRYATDASHYQIEPVGVIVPKTDTDVRVAMAAAREEGVPVAARRWHLPIGTDGWPRPGHGLQQVPEKAH